MRCMHVNDGCCHGRMRQMEIVIGQFSKEDMKMSNKPMKRC